MTSLRDYYWTLVSMSLAKTFGISFDRWRQTENCPDDWKYIFDSVKPFSSTRISSTRLCR